MERYGVYSISPYSVGMRENTDQKNSEYGHFLRSVSDSSVMAVEHDAASLKVQKCLEKQLF